MIYVFILINISEAELPTFDGISWNLFNPVDASTDGQGKLNEETE